MILWRIGDEAKPNSTAAINVTGITPTKSFAMVPTPAVSDWYFAHPDAKYFGVAKVERDQVTDYAARKGMSLPDMERWLAPNLNYDPDAEDRAGVAAA